MKHIVLAMSILFAAVFSLSMPTHAAATKVQIQTKTEVFWCKTLSDKNPSYIAMIDIDGPYSKELFIRPDKKKKVHKKG